MESLCIAGSWFIKIHITTELQELVKYELAREKREDGGGKKDAWR